MSITVNLYYKGETIYQNYRRNTPCFSYGDVAAFCFETKNGCIR